MNPVFLSESLRSSSSSGRSSSGASSAATFTGSLIRNGFAKTVTESSETASSTPLRSTIVPRRAGSAMSSICWLTARSDSEPALTVPSQVARRAARPSSSRKTANSRPMRRSTSRTGGRPGPRWRRRVGGRRWVAGTASPPARWSWSARSRLDPPGRGGRVGRSRVRGGGVGGRGDGGRGSVTAGSALGTTGSGATGSGATYVRFGSVIRFTAWPASRVGRAFR